MGTSLCFLIKIFYFKIHATPSYQSPIFNHTDANRNVAEIRRHSGDGPGGRADAEADGEPTMRFAG